MIAAWFNRRKRYQEKSEDCTKIDSLSVLKNMWVGKQIISISNGFVTDVKDQSISKGIILDIIPITKGNVPTPVVKYDNDNTEYLAFSTILVYTDELWIALNKLTPEERWDLIQSFVHRFNSRI